MPSAPWWWGGCFLMGTSCLLQTAGPWPGGLWTLLYGGGGWGRGLQYHFHKNGFAKDIFGRFWFLLEVIKTIPLQLGHHLSEESGAAGQEWELSNSVWREECRRKPSRLDLFVGQSRGIPLGRTTTALPMSKFLRDWGRATKAFSPFFFFLPSSLMLARIWEQPHPPCRGW